MLITDKPVGRQQSSVISLSARKTDILLIMWVYVASERERSSKCVCGTKKGTGLAGQRRIAIRVSRGFNKKKIRGRKKVKVIKARLMDFWHKMIFPVRRVWLTVSARIKARKNGAGLLKLHDDVQTCGYQDVQVMWQMLSKDHHSKRKQRPFWRVFEFSSNNSKPSPLSSNHA